MKRWINIGLGVAVSIGALLLALNGVPLDKVGDQLGKGNYVWVIPSILLSLLGLFLRAVRWRALLDNKLTLGHSYNILNVGYFFNSFLPARLGEVARIYLASRLKPPIAFLTTLSTIVVERLIDTLVVLILIVLALTITPSIDENVRRAAFGGGALAILGLFVLIVLAARRQWAYGLVSFAVRIAPILKRLKPEQLTDRILDGVAPLTSPSGAASTLSWTVAAWALSVAAAYVLMPLFYPSGDWSASLLMVAFASLAIAFPAVPGSVGPFELAVVLALRAAGLNPLGNAEAESRAVAFAVILHICNVFCYVSTGYLGLVREQVSIGQIIDSARNLARRKPEPA